VHLPCGTGHAFAAIVWWRSLRDPSAGGVAVVDMPVPTNHAAAGRKDIFPDSAHGFGSAADAAQPMEPARQRWRPSPSGSARVPAWSVWFWESMAYDDVLFVRCESVTTVCITKFSCLRAHPTYRNFTGMITVFVKRYLTSIWVQMSRLADWWWWVCTLQLLASTWILHIDLCCFLARTCKRTCSETSTLIPVTFRKYKHHLM
jgi:hypothetical protein